MQEDPQHPYSERKSLGSGEEMSHFLISLWANGKEEHVHPCGHFLWFLSHGLFGLFMFSVVNLARSGFILVHVLSQSISAPGLLALFENE